MHAAPCEDNHLRLSSDTEIGTIQISINQTWVEVGMSRSRVGLRAIREIRSRMMYATALLSSSWTLVMLSVEEDHVALFNRCMLYQVHHHLVTDLIET